MAEREGFNPWTGRRGFAADDRAQGELPVASISEALPIPSAASIDERMLVRDALFGFRNVVGVLLQMPALVERHSLPSEF